MKIEIEVPQTKCEAWLESLEWAAKQAQLGGFWAARDRFDEMILQLKRYVE